MFPNAYFPAAYWAPRYWPKTGEDAPIPLTDTDRREHLDSGLSGRRDGGSVGSVGSRTLISGQGGRRSLT